MSITISNCAEICNSPLNQSKSKMLYSFSKEDRFKKQQKILCDKFYDLPPCVEKKSTSFGYGTKSDFTKSLPKTPPPNTYNIRTLFDESKDHKVGFGFGEGREEMQCTGPLAEIRTNKNPGPGTYELPSTLCKTTYSFRERTNLENDQSRKVPGPGNYPVTFTINKTGTYFLSKFKNSRAATFNPKRSERFRYSANKVPGPGSYDMSQTYTSPEGKYFPSQFRCSLVRTFPHSVRKTVSTTNLTPGPGNYQLPSEFGYYVAKDFAKGDKENRQVSPQSKQQE